MAIILADVELAHCDDPSWALFTLATPTGVLMTAAGSSYQAPPDPRSG
jgi:hypothetical protein